MLPSFLVDKAETQICLGTSSNAFYVVVSNLTAASIRQSPTGKTDLIETTTLSMQFTGLYPSRYLRKFGKCFGEDIPSSTT